MAGYGNAVLFYQMLLRNGVPPQSAMGALTSIMGESGQHLNPGSHNPNDPGAAGSVGMAQWNQGRLDNLRRFAASKGTDIYDPNTQIGFIEQELQGPYSHVLNKLRSTTDYGTAANVWTADYESPAVNNTGQRIAGNRAVVNSLNLSDGNAVPEYGSGGGGGSTRDANGNLVPIQPLGAGDTAALASDLAALTPRRDATTDLADDLAAVNTPARGGQLASTGLRNEGVSDTLAGATRLADTIGAVPARDAPELLSVHYDQAKLRGGPLANANLASLFKVKDVGLARQVQPTRRIA